MTRESDEEVGEMEGRRDDSKKEGRKDRKEGREEREEGRKLEREGERKGGKERREGKEGRKEGREGGKDEGGGAGKWHSKYSSTLTASLPYHLSQPPEQQGEHQSHFMRGSAFFPAKATLPLP